MNRWVSQFQQQQKQFAHFFNFFDTFDAPESFDLLGLPADTLRRLRMVSQSFEGYKCISIRVFHKRHFEKK